MKEIKEWGIDNLLVAFGLLIVGYVIVKRGYQLINYAITGNVFIIGGVKSFFFVYGGIILSIFLICFFYLIFNKKLKSEKDIGEEKYENAASPRLAMILNILFFVFLTFALIFLFFSEPYSRPLSYLIFICFAFAVIASEIIFLSKNSKYVKFILLHLVILAVVIRLVPHLRFFDLLGADPYTYRELSNLIISNGHVVSKSFYSLFTGMHYITASTSLLTGLSYKLSALASIGSFFVSALVLLFFIGKRIINTQVGLFAVLIVIICDQLIASSLTLRPVVLGLAASIFIINSLIREKKDNIVRFKIIAIVFMVLLIISHMYTSIVFLIIIFSFLFGNYLYIFMTKNRIKEENLKQTKQILGIVLVLLFFVLLFSYWGYVTRGKTSITYLENIANLGKNMLNQNIEEVKQTLIIRPVEEHRFVNFLPSMFFYTFAGIGFLCWIRKKERYAFMFGLATIGLFLCTYVPKLLGTDILMVYRINSFLYCLMSFPVALIMVKICNIPRKNFAKGVIVFFIMFLFAFIMITSQVTDKDSPLIKKEIYGRWNFYRSEIQARDTLMGFYSPYQIISDSVYRRSFRSITSDADENYEIISLIMSKQIPTRNRVIILRNLLLEKPFRLHKPEAKQSLFSIYSILYGDKEFQNVFENQRYNKLYNNKEVLVYASVRK